MDEALLLLTAGALGTATADLFARAWTGVLRAAAALVLHARGWISARGLGRRLAAGLPPALLSALLLALCFAAYFRVLNLGESALEQLGYFVGAVIRTGIYLLGLTDLIDTLFDPDKDSRD